MYSVFYFGKIISKNYRDILTFAGACLLFAHFLLREYMPTQLVGAFGAGVVFLLLYYVLCHKRDVFGFLLIIFICSHFSYAENQGGLWNLLAFGLFLVYYSTGKPLTRIGKADILLNTLLLTLVVSNLFGWLLKNQMTGASLLFSVASFLGIIFCYIFMSRIVLTPRLLRILLQVLAVVVAYMFLAAMNQRFAIIDLNTPLLGTYAAGSGGLIAGGTNRAASTLQHTELFGEYSMLLVTLTIPFVVSSMTQRFLKLRRGLVFFFFVIAVSNMLLSGTRSAFLLTVVAGISYLFVFITFPLNVVDARKRYLKYIFTGLIALTLLGSYVGLDSTLGRFQSFSDETSFRFEDVTSGEGINRGPLFLMGVQRIQNGNWFIGYGSGIPVSNYSALFNGRKSLYSDFHSLYLALPIIYGWFGTFAFLAIILILNFRLIRIVVLYRNSKHYLMPLIIGLALFWPLFLMDQYKISILRVMNYQTLFWLYLGISSAAIRTFYYYRPQVQKEVTEKAIPAGRIG